ncbi:integral membrane regulatory protein [Streptomyces filamentosus NRRL 15998]|uniref:Integral membrane regulatory protein n=1 Tax=Streptomyces filamentosus NRRL 15998 TaxID=457431 RepID=D6AHM7_STRFL|nr:integral membrane regulatory protein [Streptomyces filamentosus NRRL 15998]
MSVHSHSAAPNAAAAAPEFPRHVVTAVLVSHDGARWLPDVLAGLLGQERPVQNVIAADTGSADDSARLVTEALGDERVLHLARRTSFGTAVDEAARTAGILTPDDLPYLKRPSGWDPQTRTWVDENYDLPELPHGEPVQWLWLLHDDCAPEPDALAEMLRVVDTDQHATIVGPKLRGWYDRKQLLEVGVSIANSGRRWTGLDRREQDQGQHDQVRTVLSVSSAGMLIRRDVYEELGGFDRRLPLMRDDVDLCWRAHLAGHRVLVAPDAVLRHAEASARERRPIDCAGRSVASPHRVDKAGAVYTMLVNARGKALPWVLLRLVVGTLLRTLAYLVGKVPGQALDEVTGLLGTLLRPGRILAARRNRGKGVVDAAELRALFPPPGATVRATVDQVAGNFGGRTDSDSGGSRHGAVESGPGGDDADFLEVDQFARLKRIGRKPGPVLFALLLVVSLVACRKPAQRRRARGRRATARPRRARRALGPVRGRLAHGGHRRHPDRPALPRPARRAVGPVPRLDRARRQRAAGLLDPAGRGHRLLRLPPAAPLPAAAGLGEHRVRLPARRDRRPGHRPPGHRRPPRPPSADRPCGRRRPRAARRQRGGGARQLARHLGVHAAADRHHGVHPDRLAARRGPRPRCARAAARRHHGVRAPLRRRRRHPGAGPRPLVAEPPDEPVRAPDRGGPRPRYGRGVGPRPARHQPRRPRCGGRHPAARHRAGRARRPAARGPAVRRPHRLGRRARRLPLRRRRQRVHLGRTGHPRLRHRPDRRRPGRRGRGPHPGRRAELRLAAARRRPDRAGRRAGPGPGRRRLDDRRRRRPAGAPRPRPGARLRRGGEHHPRPAPHPHPGRHLARHRLVQPGPRLGGPARRRRTDRGGRQQQPPRQGRRQPRRRLRRRPGRPAQRLRDPLRPRPGRSTARDEPGPRLDPGPEPPQPARRQRAVAGGPPGRPRHDHPGLRRGRARRGRLGRRRGPLRDPVRRGGPCAADRGRRRPGLDGDAGRQAADPQDRRRLGPGLRTARERRPPRPHPRRPDHPHRVDLGPDRAARGPGGHGPAGPPPGDRRRPARRGARRRRRAGRRRGPPRPQAARRGPGRGGGRVGGRGCRGPGGVHPGAAVRRPVRREPPGARPAGPARPAGGHRRLCGGPAAAGGSAAVRRVRPVGRAAAADRRLLRGVPAAGPVRPAATAGAGERRLPGRLRSPGPVRAAVRRPGHVQRPRRVQRPGRLRRPGHVRRPGRRVQRPGRVRQVRPVRRRAAAPVHRERRTDRPPGPGAGPVADR